MMIPLSAAYSAAVRYSSIEIRSTSANRSSPTRPAACSAVSGSSCPSAAFVVGVKIGSGSRSDSRSPSGRAIPQTSPLSW